MKTSEILALSVTSPEDLCAQLSDSVQKKRKQCRYISLAICGQQVLVQPFYFSSMSINDLRTKIEHEAVELLSLPVESIQYDFQILSSDKDGMSGVFVCAPKALIDEYIEIIDNAKIIPLKITTLMTAGIDAFYKEHKMQHERVCFINFVSPNMASLAVFYDQEYELLRQIYFDNLDEARQEVIRSLQSANANSQRKEFHRIYLFGDVKEKGSFVSVIGNICGVKVKQDETVDVTASLSDAKSLFSLNLAKNYSLTPKTRGALLAGANAVLFIIFGFCLYLGQQLYWSDREIKTLQASYVSSDVEYANTLKSQLKALK